MNTKLKSLAAAAALALTAMSSHAVTAGTTVTINEGSIPGAIANVFQADQLSGQYDEVISFTGATTFVTDAYFSAGQWFNSGAALQTGLNGLGAAGYGIYAKFVSTGNYATVGGVTSFTATSAMIQLYADPDHNTRYVVGASATGNINGLGQLGTSITTDDFLLGTASILLTGNGSANPGGTGSANGNFELLFSSFDLANPGGLAYFIAPRPFNLELDLNGNFQAFTPTSGTSVQLLNNSANAFFLPNAVPEPSALALAGIALVGAAVATRRKSRKG